MTAAGLKKFRLLDAPVSAPGQCGACGSSSNMDRKYVEFGLQVSYNTGDPYAPVGNNNLYLCTFCLAEAASVAGFSSEISAMELKALKSHYQERISLLDSIEKSEILERWRSDFEQYLARLTDILRDGNGAVPTVAPEDSERADETNVKNGKPDSSGRSNDISGAPSSGTDFTL